jgi:alpha-tubulin suppressor-like RCC1 family protein
LLVLVFFLGLIPGFGPKLLPASDGTVLTASTGRGEQLRGVKIRPVKTMDQVSHVTFGSTGNVFVIHDGELWAWGEDNDSGQLGNGSTSPSSTPTKIEGLPPVVALSAGAVDAYGVDLDGQVWGWGQYLPLPEAYSGRDSLVAVPIPGLPPISALVSSQYATYALDSDGDVWGWGQDVERLMGYEEDMGRLPTKIPGIDHVSSLATAGHVTLALRDDDTVWAWGFSPLGEIGTGDLLDQPTPKEVPGLGTIVSIARGESTSYAVTDAGEVYCWGSNLSHQCGSWDDESAPDEGYLASPRLVEAVGPVTHLLVTPTMAYAWTDEGIMAWGSGWGATLVDNPEDSDSLARPTALPDLPSITTIVTHESTTYLLAGSW